MSSRISLASAGRVGRTLRWAPVGWFSALIAPLISTLGSCAHAERGQQPEVPRPGVPQQELALLEREYYLNARQCNRTAEEVVDIQRRCDAAHWDACFYAATMYWRGCGVALDPVQAEDFYQRSCRFGSALGCTMAAAFEKDLAHSIDLLTLPCARGYPTACSYLGTQLVRRGEEADVARAADLLDTACRDDEYAACSELGGLVMDRKLEARFDATRGLLEYACKARHPHSCYMLAEALDAGSLGTVDHQRAAAVSSGACQYLRHLPSCHAFGHMVMRGRVDETDPWQGLGYLYQACNAGYGPACDSMGAAIEKGWRGPATPADALPYYDRACELGTDDACKRARELRAGGSSVERPTGT